MKCKLRIHYRFAGFHVLCKIIVIEYLFLIMNWYFWIYNFLKQSIWLWSCLLNCSLRLNNFPLIFKILNVIFNFVFYLLIILMLLFYFIHDCVQFFHFFRLFSFIESFSFLKTKITRRVLIWFKEHFYLWTIYQSLIYYWTDTGFCSEFMIIKFCFVFIYSLNYKLILRYFRKCYFLYFTSYRWYRFDSEKPPFFLIPPYFR